MNIYIVCEIKLWPFKQSLDFRSGNSLFWTVKLTKNADFDKYNYSGYGNGFDANGSFSLSDGSGFRVNVKIFGADMSSSGHVDNTKKDNLIFGKCSTQGLDDATLNSEKKYVL